MVALSQAKITLEDIEGIFADEDLGTDAVLEAQLQYQANQGVPFDLGACPEVASQLTQFSHVTGEDWTSKWTEAAEEYTNNLVDLSDVFERECVHNSESAEDTALAANADATERMNDAEILGKEPSDYDFEAFLDRPMVFMTGDMYGQNDRRNTRSGKWKRVEMPLINWMVGGELNDGKPWGLTRHPVHPEKGGSSIVPSDNFDGERTAEATHTMYAIGIDIDTGKQLAAVRQKLLDAGIFALIYTTHSHLKSSMSIKTEVIQKALNIKDTPTRAQVQEYLTHHHKERNTKDWIADIQITDAKKHTKNGLHVEIAHPAVEKFRVVIPLEEPVKLTDLADSFLEWKAIWADAVAGVCVNMLDCQFDTASCDINRLFYSPRHPEGGEFYIAVILGKPLNFDDIEPYSKDKYVRDRRASGDPFLADASGDSKEVGVYLMPKSGKSLNEWHKHAKNRFELVDVIQTYAPDKIRVAGGERQGTIHIECPFEHEHTTPGGTACMVMNPDANKDEVWTVFCHHDSCAGRHKLEFLQQMLIDNWFDESVLLDESYMMPLPDQDRDDYLEAQRAGPLSDLSEEGVNAALADASISKASSIGDIETLMRRCFDGGAKQDKMARNRVNAALVKATGLTKRDDLNPIWKRFGREATTGVGQSASADGALNTGAGFDSVFPATVNRLRAANDSDPFLFEMRGELFELRKKPDGPKLKMLNYDGLSEVISRRVKFVKPEGEGTISIEPPIAVVKHVFHRDRSNYALPLVAISEVPFFDKHGRLVCENGYHFESAIFVSMPDGLEVPRVSENPSDEELDRAFDLFLEVMGEFPFDGLTSDEIAQNRSASLANCIGLACLPFMRPMIEGPTPGHLINKPEPGTGAGLLLHIIHMIWTGRKPGVMTMPKRREEIPKTIIAKLRSGAFVIIFDNIPNNLDSDDLAVALSEGALDARVLGRNDAGAVDPVEINAIWVFTGNDVTMSDELLRRMTLIDLDAGMTNPEKRTFSKNEYELKAWVRDNRGDLVWACLTLIQNWIAKKRQPFDSDLVKGTFSEWLAAVGGVMQAADLHQHFYGNETKLREDSTSASDDAVYTFCNVLADYLPGHLFRVGGNDPSSFMNLLNEGPDGSPILIRGWGYSEQDGRYLSASGLGHHIKKFARRPYKARRTIKKGYVEVEIGLDREYDEKAKVHGYRLKFRAPSAKDWITSCEDDAWKELVSS